MLSLMPSLRKFHVGTILISVLVLAAALNGQMLKRSAAINYADVELVKAIAIPGVKLPIEEYRGFEAFLISVNVPDRTLGVLALHADDTERAISYLSSRGNYVSIGLLAETYFEQGRDEKAVHTWLALYPTAILEKARYFGIQAERARNREEWTDVIRFGKLAVALNPSLSLAYRHLGYAYAQLGQIEAAVDSYRVALELESEPGLRSMILAELAEAYESQGSFELARQSLLQAIAESSRNLKALFALGSIYLSQGEVSQALATYESVVEIDPSNVQAFVEIGNIYLERGALDTARSWYERAHIVGQDSGFDELALGRFELESGNAEDAIEYLQQATNLLPSDHRFVWVDLARSYEAAGNSVAASSAYEKALERLNNSPEYLWVWEEFANSLMKQGNYIEAEAVWHHILSVDPANTDAREAIRTIDNDKQKNQANSIDN